jgi:hypothetical protein
MSRLPALVLAALLVAGAAPAGEALRFHADVSPPSASRPDPGICSHLRAESGPLYGGLDLGLRPDPGQPPRLDVTVGLRPSLGRTALDVQASSRLGDALPYGLDQLEPPTTYRLALDRSFGARTDVATAFILDPDAALRAEARAAFRLTPVTTLSFRLSGGRDTARATFTLDCVLP